MEQNFSPAKVAIVGCGAVGASIAFSLVQSGMMAKLVLIDVNKEKAKGEAMDLNHAMTFSHPQIILAGDYPDITDCGLVIICAGLAQKEGQKRTELVASNLKILYSILDSVKQYAPRSIVMIVTNPVDILTYAALCYTGFPPSRILGTGTVLDTGRYRFLLGTHFGLDNRNIHAIIAGEHGDNEFPILSSAGIAGVDLTRYCYKNNCDMCTLNELFAGVRDSAYEIIAAKGATCYGIAMAVKRIVSSIIRNEKSVLTVSSLLRGEYGYHGVCASLPAVVSRSGVEKVIVLDLDENEKLGLQKAIQAMKEIIDENDIRPFSEHK
ncbi:MAG TPA: L-lactate dehydrogenase [Clostridiales bacterium]|nr:L-lactate dehydrogenase [Clostridiales bacterium]